MNSIIELATLITEELDHSATILCSRTNDAVSQVDCVKHAMKAIMQKTKGHISPSLIEQL